MSTLTNRIVLLAAAAVLPACGGATTSSSAATDAATDPANDPPAVAVAAASTVSSAPAATAPLALDPTTVASAEQDRDPEHDPDPVPGEEPDDLVPPEPLDGPGVPAEPTPVDPFVRVPFTAIPTPVPINPVPPFLPVTLVADLEPGTPAAGDRTFTAATGCGSHCITNAQISTVGGASTTYDLAVDLDVSGQPDVEAFLSQAPIERNADGQLIPPFSEPTASGQAGSEWAPGVSHWETSFALEPATTYHLLVRARDAQGQSAVAGTFTTAEAIGPDVLATPSPCLDGCLDAIRVEAADDGRSLSIDIGATVDADVEVAWASGSVVQTDDGPLIPNAHTETMSIGAGGRTTTTMNALEPNTAYSFIITATDSFGSSDRWVATVATTSPKITVGIDRIHVSGDGDDGRWNRGEISFSYGSRDGHWGFIEEDKISSNTTLRLDNDAAHTVSADAAGDYPWIALIAGERDGYSLRQCFVEADPNPDGDWRPDSAFSYCNNARTTYSQIATPLMTMAEIEQLSDCAALDIDWAPADRCMLVETAPNSSEQVSFEFVVWFDLDGR